jgi:serine/threonine protein kinase
LLGDKPTQDWTADSNRERPRTDLGPVPDAPKTPGPTLDPPVPEGPRRVIGPYKLLEQIGEGGMGVVYMAEQIEPVERQVALKIIKPGMDSRQVIARFEAEEQALAMMDHPNIAKVAQKAKHAGSRRTGLDRDEGPGERPHPPLRDGQRICE